MSNELYRLNVTKACTLKLPIENYVLDYFVNPSQTLRRPFA